MGYSKNKVEKLLDDFRFTNSDDVIDRKTNRIMNKKILQFIIYGKPENYVRERSGKGNHFYNPKECVIKDFRSKMIKSLTEEDYKWTRELIKNKNQEYEVGLNLDFYIPIQKSDSSKMAAMKEMKLIVPTIRPDLDNYQKLILDALHDVIYDDDSKVSSIIANKFYSMYPRTEIKASILLF